MANTFYSSITINPNDYSSTPSINNSQARQIIAGANDFKQHYTPNSSISITNVVVPNLQPINPILVPQSNNNIGLLNSNPLQIDVTDIGNDIRKSVSDPGDLIPGTHTNSNSENIMLKYALDNILDVLNILISNIGKKFDLVTEDGIFSITIKENNIPHLLAFISKGKLMNNTIITRFYEAIKEEFSNGNTNYLQNIQNIINTYKKEIFETIKSQDPTFDKEAWSKISSKTSNLKSLEDLIRLNSINNIEVMIGKEKLKKLANGTRIRIPNNNDTYLLMMPVEGETNYVSIVIEKAKNEKEFYIKSDCLITRSAYNDLPTSNLEGIFFSRTSIYDKSLLFDNSNNSIYDEFNKNSLKAKNVSNQNMFSLYNLTRPKKDAYFETFSKTDDKIKSFLNIDSIISKIKKELRYKIDDENLKSKLPTLLLNYFIATEQNYEEKNRFYYLLSELYCEDKDILNTIKECFAKNKRQSFQEKIYGDKENLFECSISKSDDLYLKLNMISNNQQFGYFNSTVKSFDKEYTNIRKNLEELLEKIKSFEINTNENALEYLFLLNTYYELEIMFNNSIKSIKSFSNISDFAIKTIKNTWFNIYDKLVKIGYLNETNIDELSSFNYKSFDELIENYISNKNLEISEEVENAINLINYERNSENITNILLDLNQEQMEFVLYVQEINILRSIVSKLQDEESAKIYMADINKSVNRFEQLSNIRKNTLKKSYVRTLKMAG